MAFLLAGPRRMLSGPTKSPASTSAGPAVGTLMCSKDLRCDLRSSQVAAGPPAGHTAVWAGMN